MDKRKIVFRILVFCLVIFGIFIVINNNDEEKKIKYEEEHIDSKKKIEWKFLLPLIIEQEYEKKPEFSITDIKDERDKKKFDKKLREKLIELLNMPSIELKKIFIVNSVDRGTYYEERLFILTSENTIIDSYLLKPKNIEGKAPLILAMHQHGGNYEYGKEEVVGNKGNPELAYGKELAERGYVVFASDAPLFGERGNVKGENSLEVIEQVQAQGLFAVGRTFFGVIVTEDLLALDYLTSLDFVDKDSIGCIGHSLGGRRCLFLSALDERVKANYLSSAVGNIKRGADYGIVRTWLTFVPGLGKYAETSSILALIAPRQLFILHTENDPVYLVAEVQDNVNELVALYKLLNKEDNLNFRFIGGESHTFPQIYHEEAYVFFDKSLKKR